MEAAEEINACTKVRSVNIAKQMKGSLRPLAEESLAVESCCWMERSHFSSGVRLMLACAPVDSNTHVHRESSNWTQWAILKEVRMNKGKETFWSVQVE